MTVLWERVVLFDGLVEAGGPNNGPVENESLVNFPMGGGGPTDISDVVEREGATSHCWAWNFPPMVA